ncbi:ATP-binding protein [Methylomonas sp. AM2-LC]|uniref:sensor histidine kinase n=1 Tax=Methylomonas sp. AM2-LC TaxID=3153301 RepID=UPI003267E4B2
MNLDFQSRIVLFFSMLIVGVQLLTLVTIYWVGRENLLSQSEQNLLYAENIFKRMLTEQGEQMASETRILAADFGFRSAVSDSDQTTVNSALENLTYRIHGQRGFYVDLQGNIVADTSGRLQKQPFMFPVAINNAETQGKTVGFAMLDGEFCQLSVAPVLAPLPIGWVVILNRVDQGLVEKFKQVTANPPDISLLLQTENKINILSSSLRKPDAAFFLALLRQAPVAEDSAPKLVNIGHVAVIALARPLHTARSEQAISLVLHIDLLTALQPYLLLVYASLALMVFGLLATLCGTYYLAKNISQPVRELADASQRLLDGGFDEPLTVTRRDEWGLLAETFNQAGRIAKEIITLKEQDLLRREMVASVSHDLRTPLTSLHGYLETMQLKANQLPEAERERFLAVAVRQSEKVGRLAQELFELAKLECQATPVQLECFNLLDLVQDVIHKYSMTAKQRGLNLNAILDTHVPMVFADIAMIERVLTNLIDNALRHTSAGGEVKISISVTDSRLRVSITDTGEGIAAEYLPRLFERDSRIMRQHKPDSGGLGLQIVAKIVALHGGSVHVESSLGMGSMFSFDLAIAEINPIV